MADPTSSVTSSNYIRTLKELQEESRTVGNKLDQSAFLKLLAAQLQYQDPLEPVKDSDFIAQLAQFTSLQQMENLNKTMTTYQYFSLAGKYVYAEVTLEDGSTGAIQGIVDRVLTYDGKTYAQIGDYLVECDRISQVYDSSLFESKTPLLDYADIVGKTVSASYYMNPNSAPVEEIIPEEEEDPEDSANPVTGGSDETDYDIDETGLPGAGGETEPVDKTDEPDETLPATITKIDGTGSGAADSEGNKPEALTVTGIVTRIAYDAALGSIVAYVRTPGSDGRSYTETKVFISSIQDIQIGG